MKRGIVSDIHGNLPALAAVLKDAARLKLDEIVCLGDVVGYGARPRQCLDVARQFPWTVKGNHEMGLVDVQRAQSFSARARDALDWTRELLGDPADAANEKRMGFCRDLPESHTEGDVVYCHGSPADCVNEYVFPNLHDKKPERLQAAFDKTTHVAFVGHTHFPGVFTEDGEFHTLQQLANEFEIGPGKAIVNVGSVGQPRDRNNRACYVVFTGETVIWRRVQYDIDDAANQIYAVEALDDSLGDRLFDGR